MGQAADSAGDTARWDGKVRAQQERSRTQVMHSQWQIPQKRRTIAVMRQTLARFTDVLRRDRRSPGRDAAIDGDATAMAHSPADTGNQEIEPDPEAASPPRAGNLHPAWPPPRNLRVAQARELRSVGKGADLSTGSSPVGTGLGSGGAAIVPNWAREGDSRETPEERARRRIRERVEDAIVEAQERGDFDNLRGKGKPIPQELLLSGDDAWLSGKTLSNSGFLPAWLQLQHEIDDDLAECRRLVERVERFPPSVNRQRPLDDLQQRLEQIRAKTRRYNLMVPVMSLQRTMPDTDALSQRMARAVNLP